MREYLDLANNPLFVKYVRSRLRRAALLPALIIVGFLSIGIVVLDERLFKGDGGPDPLAGVQLFSRYNDWTSDRVPGLPIEICRYGKEGEDEIVARYAGHLDEIDVLRREVGKARARAALQALREPSEAMLNAACDAFVVPIHRDNMRAHIARMIDAALSEQP